MGPRFVPSVHKADGKAFCMDLEKRFFPAVVLSVAAFVVQHCIVFQIS